MTGAHLPSGAILACLAGHSGRSKARQEGDASDGLKASDTPFMQ